MQPLCAGAGRCSSYEEQARSRGSLPPCPPRVPSAGAFPDRPVTLATPRGGRQRVTAGNLTLGSVRLVDRCAQVPWPCPGECLSHNPAAQGPGSPGRRHRDRPHLPQVPHAALAGASRGPAAFGARDGGAAAGPGLAQGTRGDGDRRRPRPGCGRSCRAHAADGCALTKKPRRRAWRQDVRGASAGLSVGPTRLTSAGPQRGQEATQ